MVPRRHWLRLDLIKLRIRIKDQDRAVHVIEVDHGLAKLILKSINSAGDLCSFLFESGYGVRAVHASIQASK